MKNGEFEDQLDAMVGMCMAMDMIFENYDKNKFLFGVTSLIEGNA